MDFTRLTLISPSGIRTDLSDPTCFLTVESSGLGLPPLHRLSQRPPLQHGTLDAGFRLDPRTVTLKLKIRAQTPIQLYQRRAALLNAVRPEVDALTLEVTLPNEALRLLACHIEEGLTFDSGGRLGLVLETRLSLSAPDPAFYDPNPKERVFPWDTAVQLTFPASFPLAFGEGWQAVQAPVEYAGSWRAYPIVSLCGPLNQPRLVNAATGAVLSVEGDIPAGESLRVDTRPGHISAVSSRGQNWMHLLSLDSDPAGFYLVPGIQNAVTVSGLGGAPGSTQITLEWYDQYLGL